MRIIQVDYIRFLSQRGEIYLELNVQSHIVSNKNATEHAGSNIFQYMNLMLSKYIEAAHFVK